MYILAIEARQETAPAQNLLVWCNDQHEEQAQRRVLQFLRESGWQSITVTSVSPTEDSDYFPPCLSYNAFEKARQEGIALRLLV